MAKIITFDTNILVEKNTIENIQMLVKKYSRDNHVYITQVVLDELTVKFYNDIHKAITPHSNSLDYFGVRFDHDLIRDELKFKKVISDILLNIFKNNIIPHNEVTIEEVYNRSLIKLPPFIKEASSDKGFKDTLIWLSLLQFNTNDFDKTIFVTKDKGFSSNFNLLQNEYAGEQKKDIILFDSLISLDVFIDGSTMVNKTDKKKDTVTGQSEVKDESNRDLISNADSAIRLYTILTEYRAELNTIFDDLFYCESSTYNSAEPRFHIYSHMNFLTFDEFLLHLSEVLEKTSFCIDIDPYNIFKPYIAEENFRTVENIETSRLAQYIKKLIEIYQFVPEYSESILVSMISKFNTEFYKQKAYELPF